MNKTILTIVLAAVTSFSSLPCFAQSAGAQYNTSAPTWQNAAALAAPYAVSAVTGQTQTSQQRVYQNMVQQPTYNGRLSPGGGASFGSKFNLGFGSLPPTGTGSVDISITDNGYGVAPPASNPAFSGANAPISFAPVAGAGSTAGSFGPVGGSCGPVGGSCGPVGGSCGTVGVSMGPVGGSCGPVGGSCGPVGGSCGPVGGSCGTVGGSVGPVGGSCGPVGGSCGPVGGSCGPVGGSCGGWSGYGGTFVP